MGVQVTAPLLLCQGIHGYSAWIISESLMKGQSTASMSNLQPAGLMLALQQCIREQGIQQGLDFQVIPHLETAERGGRTTSGSEGTIMWGAVPRIWRESWQQMWPLVKRYQPLGWFHDEDKGSWYSYVAVLLFSDLPLLFVIATECNWIQVTGSLWVSLPGHHRGEKMENGFGGANGRSLAQSETLGILLSTS